MRAILVTGMPGAGKSIFVEVARELGLPVFVMGECVIEETRRRGLEVTPENVASVARKLREELGKAAVAILTLRRVKQEAPHAEIVVIDGVRSLDEVEEFKKFFDDVVIVAVHAPPKVRYERQLSRGRPDDATRVEDLVKRDLRELEFGIGSVIAMADYMLVNVGKTIEEFKDECLKTLREILAKWGHR